MSGVTSSSQTWSSGTISLTLAIFAEPVPEGMWEHLGPVIAAIETFINNVPSPEVGTWRPQA